MDILVTPTSGHRGTLRLGDDAYACALGRSGVTANKHEGDGATPAGRFPLRAIRYRADRLTPPDTGLPAAAIDPADGWCDAPDDPAHYNRPVSLPHATSAERMWRDDGLYDLLVILGHNDAPPVPGLGSAIFLHCARIDGDGILGPTEGCVALPRTTLLELVPRLAAETMIEIRAGA